MTRRSTHMILAATGVLSLGLWTGCGDGAGSVPQGGGPMPAPATSGDQLTDGFMDNGESSTEPNGTSEGNQAGNKASQSAAQEQVGPTPEASPIIVEPTATPIIVEPTATPIIVEPTATPIIIVPTPTVSPTAVPTASPTASPSATPRHGRDRDRHGDHDRDRDRDGEDRDGEDPWGDEDRISGSSAASAPSASAPSAPAAINTLQFPPAEIKVRAGEKVVWTNKGSVPYMVTAEPGSGLNPSDIAIPVGAEPFNSGDIAPGQTFSKTFKVPGTYKYFSKTSEGTGTTSTITVVP